VAEAERLGVDCVWSAEAWGHDAVTPLAFLAARTTRIKLAPGSCRAGTRTPALIAMTAMSLASMSGGRFRLGLGVSGPQVIEGWHGIEFDRPVQRMRETAEIVRRAVRGERLEYTGSIYTLPRPGGEGKALRSARQGATRDSDLPRDLVAEKSAVDGRDGRRLAGARPSCPITRASSSITSPRAPSVPDGRSRRSICRRVGWWHSGRSRAPESRRVSPARVLARRDGLAQHNFYNDAYKRAGYADAAIEVQTTLVGRQA